MQISNIWISNILKFVGEISSFVRGAIKLMQPPMSKFVVTPLSTSVNYWMELKLSRPIHSGIRFPAQGLVSAFSALEKTIEVDPGNTQIVQNTITIAKQKVEE